MNEWLNACANLLVLFCVEYPWRAYVSHSDQRTMLMICSRDVTAWCVSNRYAIQFIIKLTFFGGCHCPIKFVTNFIVPSISSYGAAARHTRSAIIFATNIILSPLVFFFCFVWIAMSIHAMPLAIDAQRHSFHPHITIMRIMQIMNHTLFTNYMHVIRILIHIFSGDMGSVTHISVALHRIVFTTCYIAHFVCVYACMCWQCCAP